MTRSLGELLRRGADSVTVPSIDLGEVVAEAGRRRRRRRHLVAAAAASAVAAIVSVTTLAVVNPGRTTPQPAPSPRITEPTGPEGDGAVDRPLTYAVGQKIHYGDTVIDTGRDLVRLLVMDAGVVYQTEDAELLFTDGSSTRMLDRAPGGDPAWYDFDPMSPAVGSLVAWVRFDEQVTLVVYDAAADEVVLEVPTGPGVFKLPTDGSDYNVFVGGITTEQVDLICTGCRGRGYSHVEEVTYDIATGEHSYPTREEVEATVEAAAPVARTLGFRVRERVDNSVSDYWPEGGIYYFDDGRLLLEIGLNGYPGPLDVEEFVADPTDPVTGEVLRFAAPSGLREPRRPMRLFHWLDDGVFALVQEHPFAGSDGEGYAETYGTIVVCRVADLSCEVAVEGPWEGLLAGAEP